VRHFTGQDFCTDRDEVFERDIIDDLGCGSEFRFNLQPKVALIIAGS
jgi:hypothetical protein